MPATTLGYTKVKINRQPLLLKIKRKALEGVVEASCFDHIPALLKASDGNMSSRMKEASGSRLGSGQSSSSEGTVSVSQEMHRRKCNVLRIWQLGR